MANDNPEYFKFNRTPNGGKYERLTYETLFWDHDKIIYQDETGLDFRVDGELYEVKGRHHKVKQKKTTIHGRWKFQKWEHEILLENDGYYVLWVVDGERIKKFMLIKANFFDFDFNGFQEKTVTYTSIKKYLKRGSLNEMS